MHYMIQDYFGRFNWRVCWAFFGLTAALFIGAERELLVLPNAVSLSTRRKNQHFATSALWCMTEHVTEFSAYSLHVIVGWSNYSKVCLGNQKEHFPPFHLVHHVVRSFLTEGAKLQLLFTLVLCHKLPFFATCWLPGTVSYSEEQFVSFLSWRDKRSLHLST